MYRRHSVSGGGCLALNIILGIVVISGVALIFWVGGVAVNYLLQVFLGKTIPIFWAGLLNLLTGEAPITTIALIVWILVKFGVIVPVVL